MDDFPIDFMDDLPFMDDFPIFYDYFPELPSRFPPDLQRNQGRGGIPPTIHGCLHDIKRMSSLFDAM